MESHFRDLFVLPKGEAGGFFATPQPSTSMASLEDLELTPDLASCRGIGCLRMQTSGEHVCASQDPTLSIFQGEAGFPYSLGPVSYTHLTLPTTTRV